MPAALPTRQLGVIAMPVSGCAVARASGAQLAAFRKSPGLPAGYELPPGFLKNSDDQTILALAVICQALASGKQLPASYEEWGVVAAANLFGRAGTYQGLVNFRADGAWGITPHMIPHHSLHAVSGTISQALRMHGPNFGISGGPNAAAEAFIAAATLISENTLPGLWVVMTGHEPEWLPGEAGKDERNDGPCLAVALALESSASAQCEFCLYASAQSNGNWPTFTLPRFMTALDAHGPTGFWTLPGCGSVCLGKPRHTGD